MKKKFIAVGMVAALGVTAVGGTLAYFTDTDEAANTFTAGNVKIEQTEKDRNGDDFVNDQTLLPIVDDKKDENGYHLGGNYIDKIVRVTNTGSEEAYIRTHIAIPAALDDGPTSFDAGANILHWNAASANDDFALANSAVDNDWYFGKSVSVDWPGNGGDWNFYTATVDNVNYNVYVATHATAVAPEATTAPNLYGIYLDASVDYDGTDYTYNGEAIDFDLTKTQVLVISEAVQADGFDTYEDQENVAFYALDKAFGSIGSYNPWDNAGK